MSAIRVRDFSFQYGNSDRLALGELNFEINDGEVLCIVGSSGSGKTTCAYAIAGLLQKHFRGSIFHGSVEFAKMEGMSSSPLFGFVFQDIGIQLSGITETVEEEIAFSLEQFGLPVEQIRERTEEQLRLFEMEHLRYRHPHSLSGGEAQMTAIASEAAKHPRILVLDEPTQALDSANVGRLLRAIARWKQSSAVVVTEETLGIASRVADRILFLEQGRQRFLGPVGDFLNSQLDFSTLELPDWVVCQFGLGRSQLSKSFLDTFKWLTRLHTSR